MPPTAGHMHATHHQRKQERDEMTADTVRIRQILAHATAADASILIMMGPADVPSSAVDLNRKLDDIGRDTGTRKIAPALLWLGIVSGAVREYAACARTLSADDTLWLWATQSRWERIARDWAVQNAARVERAYAKGA